VQASEEADLEHQFERIADGHTNAVLKSIDAHIASMQDISSLFRINDTVTRSEYNAFVEPMLKRLPGMQALEWIPRIRDSVRQEYEASVQREGFEGYRITEKRDGKMITAGRRSEYFPVHIVAPLEGNRTAFGYDLASNPTRKKALDIAIASQSLTASAPITLVQETSSQQGVLIFDPVFDSDQPQRQQADTFRGFVLTVYRMNDLLKLAMKEIRVDEILTTIIDVTDSSNHHMLARSPVINSLKILESKSYKESSLQQDLLLSVGNRQWMIQCAALPGFVQDRTSLFPVILLCFSMSLTLVVSGLLYVLANRTSTVSSLVEKRTQQLKVYSERLAATNAKIKSQKFALDQHSIVGITDPQGKIIYVNDKFCEISGYSSDELMGQDHRILNSGNHPKLFFENLWKTISDGRVWHGEVKNRAKDGSEYWVDTTIVPFMDQQKKISQYISLRTDITERKHAEETLVLQKQRLDFILEGTNVGTWEWNVQTGDVTFNERWAEIVGYSLEELAPVNIDTWLKLAHPDDLKMSGELLEQHFNGELDYYEHEARMHHKNGNWIWVLDRGKVATWTEEGKPLLISGTHQEITKRKMAEEQVESALKALKQSNQELDEFAHIASHDLKEPLRGIHNYSHFLLEDYSEKLDDLGVDKLNTLVILTQRMESLINSLLEFSRLGRSEMAYVNTDLNEIVDDVLESLRIRIVEENINIRIPQPLPVVKCDRIRIAEVFRNLISNAIKYGDKPDKWIEITYDSASNDRTVCTLCVSDNGIGVKEEHKENVFRLFKRLHGRDKFGGGTGIGLTIAKKIVERHGGTIWLESDYGIGTKFYFTIDERKKHDNNEKQGTAVAENHAY